MNNAINLVFPHQLFEHSELLKNNLPIYLVEEHLFFKEFNFHKQKIVFHRASMQFYRDYLMSMGKKVNYIDSQASISDIRLLLPHLASIGVEKIYFIEPVDDWLQKRIDKVAKSYQIELSKYASPSFINEKSAIESFFIAKKKSFFQTSFYTQQRKEQNLLIDSNNQPLGGKWSFDEENRLKYPKTKKTPLVATPKETMYWKEAVEYVTTKFKTNLGEISNTPFYPIDFAGAKEWLNDFLVNRFSEFGHYEDAILKEELILHHSLLSPLINSGLLTPRYAIETIIEYANQNNIPINSTEGIIRQIIGWREFIRGMYEYHGSIARTKNYWGFKRKIPSSFYDGTTGILPIDMTIKKILKNGYCHHIERLMVLSNFMLLCEFDPDEVYRWFMELFIDAYDWVMVPNVYGMGQFADGGLMSTKPYISGSNYIMKMSDYPKCDWQAIWDGLFWRYMDTHRSFFLSNPRLGMLVKTFDKMSAEKKQLHLDNAEKFIFKLDK